MTELDPIKYAKMATQVLQNSVFVGKNVKFEKKSLRIL